MVQGDQAQRPADHASPEPLAAEGALRLSIPDSARRGRQGHAVPVHYHLPYSGGKFTSISQCRCPPHNLGVQMPKSMTFTAGARMDFQPVPAGSDPALQTFMMKNAAAGARPGVLDLRNGIDAARRRRAQEARSNRGRTRRPADGNAPAQPGGGIGAPMDAPDPLTEIQSGGFSADWLCCLRPAAAFLLRKPEAARGSAPAGALDSASLAATLCRNSPAAKNAALLNALKEELFALESEKISGTIEPDEYAEVKAALETVLKRALKRQLVAFGS